jgi:DNA repair protein radC
MDMENNNIKLSITDLPLEDRPREKMMLRGINALSSAELLAILIGSGNKDETAVELSQRILNSAGNNLSNLGKYNLDDFVNNFKGIGPAKAITIMAALELGRRRKEDGVPDRPRITCSEDAYKLVRGGLIDLPYEVFKVILLNRANRIIDILHISQGGTASTIVDVKLVMKPAIQQLATGMILCHNHPSNNSRPSSSDDLLTTRIKEAASLLEMTLTDHIIVCEDDYYSYADEGRL